MNRFLHSAITFASLFAVLMLFGCGTTAVDMPSSPALEDEQLEVEESIGAITIGLADNISGIESVTMSFGEANTGHITEFTLSPGETAVYHVYETGYYIAEVMSCTSTIESGLLQWPGAAKFVFAEGQSRTQEEVFRFELLPLEKKEAPAEGGVHVTVRVAVGIDAKSSYDESFSIVLPKDSTIFDALVATGLPIMAERTPRGLYIHSIDGIRDDADTKWYCPIGTTWDNENVDVFFAEEGMTYTWELVQR